MYCSQCHESIDRDWNAASNILRAWDSAWMNCNRPEDLRRPENPATEVDEDEELEEEEVRQEDDSEEEEDQE